MSLRRKAKLADLARMVAPPHPESTPPPPIRESGPSATVVPPAFTVAVATGSVILPAEKVQPSPPASGSAVVDSGPVEKATASSEIHVAAPGATVEPAVKDSSTPEAPAVAVIPEPEKKNDEAPVEKPASADTKPAPPAAAGENPATTSSPTAAGIPKAGASAAPVPLDHLPAIPPEKKEFLLTNGERILGRVLSETPDTIYLEHGTLGVLTLPRTQIAQRPVEIILINGDRIVGDIMAETPDTLYVRHASLGMLTVPRAQRSTRVVEVILTDGDRILGEVLAETENFTVVRSATLGTVSVPHNKVAMLNRKVEQIELKKLPVALQDKPSS